MIVCNRISCINNKDVSCKKDDIKINEFGKCLSYRNKNIKYRDVKDLNLNLSIRQIKKMKIKKQVMLVVK